MLAEFEAYFAGAEREFLRRPVYGPGYLFAAPVFPFFGERRREWRSDARYFLAMNVAEMVVAPVASVRSEISFPEFDRALANDIEAIAARAEQVAKARDRGYVSATSVAIALGQLADKLETASFQIWGTESGDR